MISFQGGQNRGDNDSKERAGAPSLDTWPSHPSGPPSALRRSLPAPSPHLLSPAASVFPGKCEFFQNIILCPKSMISKILLKISSCLNAIGASAS